MKNIKFIRYAKKKGVDFDDVMTWAFGKDYATLLFHKMPDAFNKLHPELPKIASSEKIEDTLIKLIDIYSTKVNATK